MTEDFSIVFAQVDKLRNEADSAPLVAKIDELQQNSTAIAELLEAAQQLDDPEPFFYTRG